MLGASGESKGRRSGNKMMKKIVLIAALAAGLTGGTAHAAGSTSTANGTATATVVGPLAITHNSGAALSFGSFTTGTGGSVTVTSAGAVTASGDVGMVTGVNASADAFTVIGTANRAFGITSSSGNTVSTGGATPATMAFTVSPGTSAALNASGTYAMAVGGTLTVASGQEAGSYSGTYSVTVTYQ